MDGIEYLKKCCRASKIDPDKLLKLGRGTNGASRGRYKLQVDLSTIKDTQLYAIQYCRDIEIYIAWGTDHKNRPYSLKASKIILPMGKKEEVCSVKKAEQHLGWGEELVLYFQKEGIPDFLNRYVLNKEN